MFSRQVSAQPDWIAPPDDDDETLAAFLDWPSFDADLSGEFGKWVSEDNNKDVAPAPLVPCRDSDLSSICGWDATSLDDPPCRQTSNVTSLPVHQPALFATAAQVAPANGPPRVSSGASSGWMLQEPCGGNCNVAPIRATNSGVSTSDPFLCEEPPRLDHAYLAQQQQQLAISVKPSPFQQVPSTAVLATHPVGLQPPSVNTSPAAEPQLSENLRGHVQQQVVKLLETEFDRAQVAWLQELYSMALTSPLPLLQTLSRQLDVLLMPLPEAPAAVVAASAAVPTASAAAQASSSPFIGGAWSAQPSCEFGAMQSEKQFIMACGGSKDLLTDVSSLKASPQGSTDGFGAVLGGVDYMAPGGGSIPVSSSAWQCTPCMAPVWAQPGGRIYDGQQQQQQQQQQQMSGSTTQEHCSSDIFGAQMSTLSGSKRGRAAGEVCDTPRSMRVKAEPSATMVTGTGAASTGAGGEQRWWRKQNNFTIAIDEIVKKMQSGEACLDVPVIAPQMFSLSSGFLDVDGDGDGPSICADRVRQVYDKPIKEAAKQLGVSVMSLKRTCRKMGVRRWPFRKLASLSELEATVREDQLEQQLQPSDKEAVMQYIEAEKARIMVEPDREVDPMLHNLRKAKIHMKYEKWGRKSLGRGKAAASRAAAMDAFSFDDDLMDGLL